MTTGMNKTANVISTLKAALALAVLAGLTVSCAPRAVVDWDDDYDYHDEAPPPAVALHEIDGDLPVEPEAVLVERQHGHNESDMAFGGNGYAGAEFEQLEIEGLEKREIPAEIVGPVKGGRAKIYLHRGFMDDAIAELVRVNPFTVSADGRSIFKVTDSTFRRAEFQIPEAVRRGDGRRVTALEFIELWSRYLKSRPAQGLALFRNVTGAENFVNGKDPLVSGWNAADEKTIRIRFAKADPFAFQRMNTPKLLGGPFMLGTYYSAGSRGAETRLLPNGYSMLDTAYLTEFIVQMGGDPNPLMSFAAGQYSAMTLYLSAELEIARNELEANGTASILSLSTERYFLACKSNNEQARRFVHGMVNGAAMLRDVVKADGGPIVSVTTENPAIEIPKSAVNAPQLPKPFKIIFRNDDPVSKAIAEKLHADLNQAGMSVELDPLGPEKYETALVRGGYDCAVGWVPGSILESFAEQLHFTSMWFGDDIDPQARLRDYREIPLFYVNNYLLLRNDTRLHNDKISGIWTLPDAAADER